MFDCPQLLLTWYRRHATRNRVRMLGDHPLASFAQSSNIRRLEMEDTWGDGAQPTPRVSTDPFRCGGVRRWGIRGQHKGRPHSRGRPSWYVAPPQIAPGSSLTSCRRSPQTIGTGFRPVPCYIKSAHHQPPATASTIQRGSAQTRAGSPNWPSLVS